ncbi:membrane-bound lytic murein transglycosylase EmtA [Citrobacter sp. JGM124]|uniref:membrane-bound lytic murein transglycosylase EmtA n=1 Tax=Citrobacter sp. JGM124 TaxID=2799789 RepID=UPI001BAE53F9|nr:membrane-bound lytic murein transglycosylase EmtA [Citrobacter sp. JGM124]
MKLTGLLVLILILAGCSSKPTQQAEWNPTVPVQGALTWMPISEQTGQEWGVSTKVITAIIAVETGGNPALVSTSNAVGLMQIKGSTAGKDVYRHMGLKGQPTDAELKDPARNITIGTAYLSVLENGILKGINDPEVMEYALVVSYANGAGAMLRTFDNDRPTAIKKINRMNAQQFMQHIAKNHPAPQAARYLYKITRAMEVL